jgi:hypothetical protein
MTPISQCLDTVKNVVQIVAIIVAGIWTYIVFVRTEEPALEFRPKVTSSLEWMPIDEGKAFLGEFTVTIQNIGRRSFDIDAVHLKIWITKLPSVTSGIAFVNLDEMQVGSPAFDRTISGSALSGHYSPNTTNNFDFNFLSVGTPNDVSFIRLDAPTRQGGVITESRWMNLCDAK